MKFETHFRNKKIGELQLGLSTSCSTFLQQFPELKKLLKNSNELQKLLFVTNVAQKLLEKTKTFHGLLSISKFIF